jgi:hypothetical protein
MRSVIHVGKTRLGSFSFFLSLLLIIGSNKEVSPQSGYMGLKNQVGVDVFNSLYQGSYELEYKRSLSKHLGLVLNAGYFATKKGYSDRSDDAARGFDPVSSLTTGPVFGLGIERNNRNVGMAYPIGYCVTYGAKMGFLKIEDRYKDIAKPLEYDHTVFQTYVRMSRTYSLWNNWTLQVGARTGLMVGRAEFQGEEPPKKDFAPLRVVPAKHPFSKGGTYQIQKFDVGKGNAWRLFIMPLFRVGYMF